MSALIQTGASGNQGKSTGTKQIKPACTTECSNLRHTVNFQTLSSCLVRADWHKSKESQDVKSTYWVGTQD